MIDDAKIKTAKKSSVMCWIADILFYSIGLTMQ